jgi:hypothetical protein
MGSIAGKLLLTSLLLCSVRFWAQEEGSDDNRKSNSHLGWPISVPLNPTAKFADAGTGVTYGVGYNFSRRHAIVGEFMWDWLNTGVSSPRGLVMSMEAATFMSLAETIASSYVGKTIGAYLIAGGGWHLRDSSPTTTSALGANGGVGFTVRVGAAPWRMYIESRYHYAPTKNINTQLVITTIGIRY